jgi:hypothetical protein
MTWLIIMDLKVRLVRVGLPTKHTTHTASVQLQGLGTVQDAHPLFDWKM